MAELNLQIRPLFQLDELDQVVELQHTYWGNDEEAVIPAHMLFSIANHGGHVLTAFDNEKAVGVLVGFLGTSMEDSRRPAMANLQIVSKRMVVLLEYRGQGIGYRLKRTQRELAVKQGVRLVEWTFDPLLALNAQLNVRKLGVTCPTYLEDYYGTKERGGLTTLGASDRLLAEWWVTNRRVEERLFGARADLTLGQYLEAETPVLNPTTRSSDGVVMPAADDTVPVTLTKTLALLEIPHNYSDIVQQNPALAVRWREHTRMTFKRMFTLGYIVTDFLHERYDGRDRCFYVLSYQGPQFETVNLN
ncbi:MAG: GNAT family N-acetyltransferase [Anaerolineae bacterium]|nr:GNAT family N-acetyltransferase [Anaerolineae bacterium]